HSLEVTPCCSGPAPMIIDAQFGLLEVGMTPRACSVYEPCRISLCSTGAFVGVIPIAPNPSQPMISTCSSVLAAAGTTLGTQNKRRRSPYVRAFRAACECQ